MKSAIVIAIFGAAIEMANVAWVHFSERGAATKTGTVTALIKGLDLWVVLNVVDTRGLAVACVLGHAVGAGLAVRVKTWWLSKPSAKEQG